MQENITAIILAAGQGKRLLPHTADTPKCLVEVGGVPILHRQLSSLQKCNIGKVILVTGFHAPRVEEYARLHFPEIEFRFVRNEIFHATNTLYSLALAATHIGPDEAVLQLNGDVIFDPAAIRTLIETGGVSAAVVQRKRCGEEEIKILLGEDGSIRAMNKIIKPEEAVGEAIGINKFSPAFWETLAATLAEHKESYAYEYFEFAVEHVLANKDEKLFYLPIKERQAIEIDFPEDLRRAEELFPRLV